MIKTKIDKSWEKEFDMRFKYVKSELLVAGLPANEKIDPVPFIKQFISSEIQKATEEVIEEIRQKLVEIAIEGKGRR